MKIIWMKEVSKGGRSSRYFPVEEEQFLKLVVFRLERNEVIDDTHRHLIEVLIVEDSVDQSFQTSHFIDEWTCKQSFDFLCSIILEIVVRANINCARSLFLFCSRCRT